MKLLESGNSGRCNQTNKSFNYKYLITNIGEIMTDQEKFDFLRSAFTDLFKKEMPDVTRLTPLQDLGLDSLDIVELQLEFEERYSVEISDPKNDIKTVGDLLDHLAM